MFPAIWIIIGFVALVLLMLAYSKNCRARKRFLCLRKAGLVCSWDALLDDTGTFATIARTDLGYGTEVWVLRDEGRDIDLTVRAFKNGLLIFPRPNTGDLEAFAQAHGVKIVQIQA